jgi:hypothetical protein
VNRGHSMVLYKVVRSLLLDLAGMSRGKVNPRKGIAGVCLLFPFKAILRPNR